MMERFTIEIPEKRWKIVGDRQKAYGRLAAYEDTGMEPEEITRLKANYAAYQIDATVLEAYKLFARLSLEDRCSAEELEQDAEKTYSALAGTPITFDEEWLLWCRRGLSEANMRYMLHKQWCAQLDLHKQEDTYHA